MNDHLMHLLLLMEVMSKEASPRVKKEESECCTWWDV